MSNIQGCARGRLIHLPWQDILPSLVIFVSMPILLGSLWTQWTPWSKLLELNSGFMEGQSKCDFAKRGSPKKDKRIQRMGEWSQDLFGKHSATICMDESSLWCKLMRAKHRFDRDSPSYLFKASQVLISLVVYLQGVQLYEWCLKHANRRQ